jgi:hypothetical protein
MTFDEKENDHAMKILPKYCTYTYAVSMIPRIKLVKTNECEVTVQENCFL